MWIALSNQPKLNDCGKNFYNLMYYKASSFDIEKHIKLYQLSPFSKISLLVSTALLAKIIMMK